MKKTMAIIGVGMVDSISGPGMPAFLESLKILSQHFDIILYSFVPVSKQKTPEGIRVRCVPYNGMHQRLKYLFLGALFIIDHFKTRIQIIQAQSPFPAGVLASRMHKLLNIPWILSFHAGEAARMPEIKFGDLLRPKLERISRRVSANANLITAMSAWQAGIVRNNLGINQPIHVLPRGIVVQPLKKKVIELPLRLLHISNYHPVKDYETLLNTIAELAKSTPCKLQITGGNYGAEFNELIHKIGVQDNVEFLGRIPHDQLPAVFQTAHILLHTSRFEGLPMAAIESMANGVVVCGTRVGLIADLSDTCCIGVEAGDFRSLANEIVVLTQNAGQYEKLRTVAYAWVKDHDMSWYANELKAKCEQLINNNA